MSIAPGGVTNAMLQSSTVSVNAGAGLTGGGAVPLGGSTTLAVASSVTNPPFLRLLYTAGTLLRGNTVPFTAVQSANGAAWDSTNNRFTAPTSGIYMVTFDLRAAGAVYLIGTIRVNGVGVVEGWGAAPDALKAGGAAVSSALLLSAGDTVDFLYAHDSAAVPLQVAYASIVRVGS